MVSIDCVIKNGKVFSDGQLREADVLIDDGKIFGLTKDSSVYDSDEVVDARGNLVLPGAIDTHIHSFARGYDFENFENATMGAIVGGVTSVVDMPMERPLVGSPRAMDEKLEITRKQALVDYGLLGAPCQFDVPVADGLKEVPKLIERGVVGFKIFMDGCAPAGWYVGFDDGALLEVFEKISKGGVVAATHCEDSFIIDHLISRFRSEGRHEPLAHHDSRPDVAEALGILRAVYLAKRTSCKLNVVHVSIPEGVEIIREAKVQGYNVNCETCPHYLLLTTEDLRRSNRVKCNPPVRPKDQVERMWQLLSAGWIDTVGSDHAPLPQNESPVVWDVCARGLTSVELLFPLMFSEGYMRGRISLQRLVQVISENPAKLYGLYPKKGTINVGSDADIVIVDPKKEFYVDANKMHFKDPSNAWTPFQGWRLKGSPVKSIVRGQVVVDERRLYQKPGFGQFIPKGTKASSSRIE